MVLYALKNSISQASRVFDTERNTVKHWIKKYQVNLQTLERDIETQICKELASKGKLTKKRLTEIKKEQRLKCFRNLSRMGQKHPNKTDETTIQKILDYKNENKGLGPYFIKDNLGLNLSLKTIGKILKQNQLVRLTKPKKQKKKDMSRMRAETDVMTLIQLDTKYLTDIPNLFRGIQFYNFPKYQFTARDYKGGQTIIEYSYCKDSTSFGIFASYVLHRYIIAGVDTSKIILQTDCGTEIRPITKKNGLSIFEDIATNHNVKNRYNPVGRPTYNSDVESFHARIEPELYDHNEFENLDDFMMKSWVYITNYNMFRKNRNKNHKSPAQIIKENCKNTINIKYLCSTPPIIVDKYIKDIEMVKKGGYFKWCSPKKINNYLDIK